jgi:mannosyltransferase
MEFLVNAPHAIPGNVRQPPAKGSAARAVPLMLTLITLLAAGLRFHRLAARTFWFDEGVSVGIARLDWYNFGRILWRREANMSLYYLLLRGWLHFGRSEFLVRTLSVLLAVATVPLLYCLGRKLFDWRAGMIAATLLAVNAYHVRYSQEARSYSLTVLLAVASSLYFLKLLELPSRRNRTGYVLAATAAVYAHFYSGLLTVAQGLSLLSLERESVPRQVRKAWRWIALLVAPILVFVATTGAGPLRWIERPGGKQLWQLGLRLAGNDGVVLLALYGVAVLGAAIQAMPDKSPRSSSPAWRYRFLLLWLLFPILSVFVLSAIRPLFLPRYFLLCLPALLLLAAAGLGRIRSPWIMTGATLVLVVLSLQGTASYYRQDFEDVERENWRAASEYILTHSRPGDAVMFHVPMGRMPYEYYQSLRPGSAAGPAVLYPSHGDRIGFLDFVEKPSYRQLEGEVSEHRRVWLVLSHAGDPSGTDETSSALSQLIAAGHPGVQAHDFAGLEVLLYSADGEIR